METLIPFLMASIIDNGVNVPGGYSPYLQSWWNYDCGSIFGLLAGMAGGRYGAKASAGFAKNLRNAMYDKIQTFSFANIDNFSTAGLVTSDNRCDQCAECVPDDAAYDDESTGKYDLCDGDGIYDQCKTCKYLSCGSYDPWSIACSLSSVMQLHISSRHFQSMML